MTVQRVSDEQLAHTKSRIEGMAEDLSKEFVRWCEACHDYATGDYDTSHDAFAGEFVARVGAAAREAVATEILDVFDALGGTNGIPVGYWDGMKAAAAIARGVPVDREGRRQ